LKNEGATAISMRHVLAFLKEAKKTQFSFAIFSMNNPSKQKTKYTTKKNMKKQRQ